MTSAEPGKEWALRGSLLSKVAPVPAPQTKAQPSTLLDPAEVPQSWSLLELESQQVPLQCQQVSGSLPLSAVSPIGHTMSGVWFWQRSARSDMGHFRAETAMSPTLLALKRDLLAFQFQ